MESERARTAAVYSIAGVAVVGATCFLLGTAYVLDRMAQEAFTGRSGEDSPPVETPSPGIDDTWQTPDPTASPEVFGGDKPSNEQAVRTGRALGALGTEQATLTASFRAGGDGLRLVAAAHTEGQSV